jgi:hypothetical protein
MGREGSVFLGKVSRVEAVLAIGLVLGGGAWLASSSSSSSHQEHPQAAQEKRDPEQQWAWEQLKLFEVDNGLNAGSVMTTTGLDEADIQSAIRACAAANLSQADVDTPVRHNCSQVPSVIRTFARRHEVQTVTALDRAQSESDPSMRSALLSIADYEKKSGLDEVALLDATGLDAPELAGLVMACMQARPGSDCHDAVFTQIRIKTRQR